MGNAKAPTFSNHENNGLLAKLKPLGYFNENTELLNIPNKLILMLYLLNDYGKEGYNIHRGHGCSRGIESVPALYEEKEGTHRGGRK